MPFRRLSAGVSALTLALLLTLLSGAPARAQDPPEPVQLTTGTLDWGVRASFRRYVGGDGITVSGGVTRSGDATPELPVAGFTWPLRSGTYDAATKSTTLQFGGSVHFSAHGGALDVTLADPKLVLSPLETTLYAKVTSKTMAGDLIDYGTPRVGEIDLTGKEPTGATTWSALPNALSAEAAAPFAGFYPVGTSLDPITAVYDGPGGKPVPAVESWDAPGTLKFEQTLTNPALKPTTILPDHARGVVHVVQADGVIRALNPTTLEPVGAAAPITRIETLLNASAVLDRATGAVLVQTGTRIRELHWNAETASYTVSELPGADVTDGQGGLSYNPVAKTLARIGGGAYVIWKRTDEGGWTQHRTSGALPDYLPEVALDDDGTALVVAASSGKPPVQIDWHGGDTFLVRTVPGSYADPDALQPDQFDLPSEVSTGPGMTAMLGSYYGRVWKLAKGTDGVYRSTGPSVSPKVGNVLRSVADPDGTLILGAYQGDTLLSYVDGALVGRTRMPSLGLGTTSRPLGMGVDADHTVYATSNSATEGGLWKFKRLGFTPAVSAQPAGVTVKLGFGETSKPATFTAAAGDGVAVQWQTRVGAGGRWTDVAGATSGTLSLTATPGDDGTQVRAVFTNAAGALATEVAVLRVEVVPSIAAQPESVRVSAGDDAVFKVMPAGNPYPEIRWERRDAKGFWVTIDDATTGFLTIDDTVAAMSGTELRARLSNVHGTVYSRVVTLAVETPLNGLQGVTGGFLDWGVKASFRTYIRGPIAHGAYTVSDGAAINADGTIRFPVRGGQRDAATGETIARLGGTVSFVGHDGAFGAGSGPALVVTIANPRVEFGAAGAVLRADVASKPNQAGAAVVAYPGVVLATLDASAAPVGGATAPVWSAIPARLADSGVAPFAGFYSAGTELDPLALSLTVGGPVVPETQAPPPPPPAPAPVVVPAPTATPTAAARPTIKAGAKRVKVGSSRTVTLAKVTCAAACKVTAPSKLKLRIGGRSYTATVIARSTSVRVKLSSAAVKRLGGRSVRTSVRVVVTQGTQRATLTVKPTLTR